MGFWEIVGEIGRNTWKPFEIGWGDALTTAGTLVAVLAAVFIAGDSERKATKREATARKRVADWLAVRLHTDLNPVLQRVVVIARTAARITVSDAMEVGRDLAQTANELDVPLLDRHDQFFSVFEGDTGQKLAMCASSVAALKAQVARMAVPRDPSYAILQLQGAANMAQYIVVIVKDAMIALEVVINASGKEVFEAYSIRAKAEEIAYLENAEYRESLVTKSAREQASDNTWSGEETPEPFRPAYEPGG